MLGRLVLGSTAERGSESDGIGFADWQLAIEWVADELRPSTCSVKANSMKWRRIQSSKSQSRREGQEVLEWLQRRLVTRSIATLHDATETLPLQSIQFSLLNRLEWNPSKAPHFSHLQITIPFWKRLQFQLDRSMGPVQSLNWPIASDALIKSIDWMSFQSWAPWNISMWWNQSVHLTNSHRLGLVTCTCWLLTVNRISQPSQIYVVESIESNLSGAHFIQVDLIQQPMSRAGRNQSQLTELVKWIQWSQWIQSNQKLASSMDSVVPFDLMRLVVFILATSNRLCNVEMNQLIYSTCQDQMNLRRVTNCANLHLINQVFSLSQMVVAEELKWKKHRIGNGWPCWRSSSRSPSSAPPAWPSHLLKVSLNFNLVSLFWFDLIFSKKNCLGQLLCRQPVAFYGNLWKFMQIYVRSC